jgi:hypothetical protein
VVWQDILAGNSGAPSGTASARAGVVGIGTLLAVANLAVSPDRCFPKERWIARGFAAGSTDAISGAATSEGGGVSTITRAGACSDVGFQGVQLLSRAKASTVGLVRLSAVGMDCMQPETTNPVRHRAVWFEIDSMIAPSCCLPPA